MDTRRLNPLVRGAAIYETIPRVEECIAYDSRLIYVISGDVNALVGGKKLGHLGAGTMLYIPAGTRYKFKGQYLRMAVFAFDLTADHMDMDCPAPSTPEEYQADLCHTYQDSAPYDEVILLEDMEADGENIARICSLAVAGEGDYLSVISAEIKLLLIKIKESSSENALPQRMVAALGEYIRDNIGDDISNTEVSATFGYHPFYISNVLKKSKGMTLRQYIIDYRLKLAASMLRTTAKSIQEIAEACGFSDASYFTKTFRKELGETPKEYRNRFKDGFI